MKPDDLLLERRRLFTPEPKGPGLILVVSCLLLGVLVTYLVGAYVGWVLPDGGLMIAFGLVLGVVVPALLARRIARRGWRAFAGIEVGLLLLFLLVLGGPTDRALETHGARPFHALARVLGQAEQREAPVMDAGRGVVDGLRRLARKGAPVAPSVPAPAVNVGRVDDGGGSNGTRPAPGAMVVDLPVARSGAPVVVGATVNGHIPADFVFDTGADTTLVTLALARRLGFAPESAEVYRPLRTPAGEFQAPVIRLSSIRVESARVDSLEVLVCTSCRENLLGRDFQRHFRVVLDAERGHLRLHRR
ncbi:MAG: aspartyl protease family protein [Deltaproteobacteria bacterium]|nr:aspartyl protease family protein [Deltaproteobacteria bacterium]